jgi:hypothetical protein
MYRTQTTKEGDIVHKHYSFTVFDGKFTEAVVNLSRSLDAPHVILAIVLGAASCGIVAIHHSYKYPSPPEPPHPEMSSLERCMRGPVDNNRCVEIYDKETQRLKELSSELIRREVAEMKAKLEADILKKKEEGKPLLLYSIK